MIHMHIHIYVYHNFLLNVLLERITEDRAGFEPATFGFTPHTYEIYIHMTKKVRPSVDYTLRTEMS